MTLITGKYSLDSVQDHGETYKWSHPPHIVYNILIAHKCTSQNMAEGVKYYSCNTDLYNSEYHNYPDSCPNSLWIPSPQFI